MNLERVQEEEAFLAKVCRIRTLRQEVLFACETSEGDLREFPDRFFHLLDLS